ncbi:hypothetical protein NOCA1110028 [metagenome]|uniref:Uncharacterized protein n=1 Tax=metagenome TaxID=256318 RepID=A0A2P2C2S8_9ZZZZ
MNRADVRTVRVGEEGPVIGVRSGLGGCVAGLAVLLALLGVGPVGWVAGLGCAAVLAGATGRRAVLDGVERLGPADLVTLTRATLACAVAALVGDACTGAEVTAALVPLTVLALVLDFVDGRAGSPGAPGRPRPSAVASTGRPTPSSSSCSACSSPGPPVPGCWRWGWCVMRTPSPPGWCRGCSGSSRPATGARSWRPTPASRWPWRRPRSCRQRRRTSCWVWGSRCWPSRSAGTWCGCGGVATE